MNIDIIVPYLSRDGRNGATTHFQQLAVALANAGHDVVVHITAASGFVVQRLQVQWPHDPAPVNIAPNVKVECHQHRAFSAIRQYELWARRFKLLSDAWRLRDPSIPLLPSKLAEYSREQALAQVRKFIASVEQGGDSMQVHSTTVLGPYLPMMGIVKSARRRGAVLIVGYFPFKTCIDAVEEANRQGVRCFLCPLFHPLDATHYNKLLHRSAKESAGVLCLSPFGRTFFKEMLGVRNAFFTGSAPVDIGNQPVAAPRTAGDKDEYFAFFGRYEAGKTLIEAVRIVEPARRIGGRPFRLKIIGKDSPEMRNILPSYADVLENLSTAEAGHILAGARALLVPSLFESFSIVAIEALRMGTPVLVKSCNLSTASILEFLGLEYHVYSNVEEAAGKALNPRRELIDTGKLSYFTWPEVARQTELAIQQADFK